jgi:hypothetical protein
LIEWAHENIKHIEKDFEIELSIGDALGLDKQIFYNANSLKVKGVKSFCVSDDPVKDRR